MTKEELEKEVKEYISYNPTEGSKDFVVYKVRVGENAFAYVVEHKNELSMSDWIKMYEGTERECYRVVGYLDSAEPREKQIQIDAEQIRALQKQNGELTDRVKELESQIEKMRNCANCPVWLLNQTEKNCKDCKYKEALILLRR